ncbi:PREDICTED: mediator of RNA polymerase II transcription subunit 12 isoform X2 [Nelumbo nucifera]|uniref:Mediator of RNA polymerase II transcription subunit 12 isoform X2 n=1 Tax=Nelumbo nucifera TaxID=4432 RepID=A0A1U7Z3N4_NELNU|nr:PREDICTED: mediator of RNA polymerase II transcription subunit 12 isoform X2 [Nelumbo nucifera]
MQRYSATSSGDGVSSGTVGGSARDTARVDSSFSSSNFSLSSRRPSQLTSYKLKCDKEPLNCRLGPPDFYPQFPNCPEETLTREYVQYGYKETIEGLEEAREILLSQLITFSKPVALKCKEAIRKRLRAINESRAQKHKAGQVYGVPLSGSLLLKPGAFPEQKPCGEDSRKKWIEGLSQQHKCLHFLADNVPHGFRRKDLFEVLIRHNIPLLRATWFIKVSYLNQIRPLSVNVSSGTTDKTQLARTDLWTKDIVEYLQYLLDEFFSVNRDESPQILLAGSVHKGDSSLGLTESEEPSLYFKWWYMVRIIRWHHSEGLLYPSLVIDWVLNQLQDKESLETLQLLLPIIYGLIETIVLSQTYVHNLVEVAVRSIQESSSGSDLVDNSQKAYIASAMVEMLWYLIVAVPDTFVALDCFPLPLPVLSGVANRRFFLSKVSEDAEKTRNGAEELLTLYGEKRQVAHHHFLTFDYVVSSIQKRADNLVKAVSPVPQGHGVAKAVQALDKALTLGDLKRAYNFLFEDLCDGCIEEIWIAKVSPCLQSSLKWMGTVSFSFICSLFFLFEWATCDFRDFRTSLPCDLKFTGRKDFSQVYIAVLLLKMKIEDMHTSNQCKNGSTFGANNLGRDASHHDSFSGGVTGENVSIRKNKSKNLGGRIDSSDIFESPGPVHDIIVCWIDQHEVGKGEGFKRLQLLIMELICSGIFNPPAYARQLIVSGIMDRSETLVDLDRRRRHYFVLKQLPGAYMLDFLEVRIADISALEEALNVYSNERRLLLHGLLSDLTSHSRNGNDNNVNIDFQKQKNNPSSGQNAPGPLSGRNAKTKAQVAELKEAISILLHLPSSYSTLPDTRSDESQRSCKRSIWLIGKKMDVTEGTPGCKEYRRSKKQKSSEERSSYMQGFSPNPSNDEDSWWVRKVPKSIESFKVDPPLKSTKNTSRGRQKIVRKTQSLAQLAAARIEGSQGASTSHVCDNRISCPHHRTSIEGEASKPVDGMRATHLGDVVLIGKALKQLRLLEKRAITVWLMSLVRQLVEGSEKSAAKVGHRTGHLPPSDDKSSVRWKLSEDELSSILYLMDISSDLVSAVKFLLWLLPKVLSTPNSTHGGRSILMLPKNTESRSCEVGEAFLLSSIRRYESILVAADLIPEVLCASMVRAAAVMASNGRASGSAAFVYARNLLKKYGNMVSVEKWEKNFKATSDQRLLVELESGRSLDENLGFSLGVPAGVDDLDDYFRQKLSGRLTRPIPSMKEMVQKHVDEAMHSFFGKERKLFAAGTPKGPVIEKCDDGYRIAQQIVLGLIECTRQNSSTSQEVDPFIVASAVSAIVANVGPALAKMPDFTASGNYQSFPSPITSLNCARHILRIHIACLSLLKEAIGERQSRVFEIALSIEASSAVAAALAPGKGSRSQFQLSPEAHDSSTNLSNEMLTNYTKVFIGRATKAAAAVSALVIGAVVHGAASLERMVSALRLKEGLDILQFVRSAKSSSNGISRSVSAFKVDNSIEVYLHWFRLLVGNYRTVSDGLIVELLGEPYILALSRMQRMLPLSLVLPPAYSIFALMLWRPYVLNSNTITHDVQLNQSLASAIGEAITHQPFRDVCLRDTCAFYDLLASDVANSEFVAMLEMHGADKHMKTMAFVPLRARLFLNAILDCKIPQSMISQDDGVQVSGSAESKLQHTKSEIKLQDQLVHVLDTLQPAKFHWQWVELRLLLNEQALIEKIDTHNMSFVEAIRSLFPNSDNSVLSENENNFNEIILTRLLVRPDASPLYSEVVHLLGKSLEESLLLHAKWFLAGHDVLFGRKSIRQRLINVAQLRGLSTKIQFWKPWGWPHSAADLAASKGERKKFEVSSLEEGEVVEEGIDFKRLGRVTTQILDAEVFNSSQQYATERALIELVLPCIDRSSSESRNTFANELIKQMNNIEQQINAVTHGINKQAGAVPSGIEGSTSKSSSRKGTRHGSPGLGRRLIGLSDSAPPSSAALRASMWLRLQFLLRFLPLIYADRNMRQMLASIILRLLGSRVVHEDADLSYQIQSSPSKREVESPMEPAVIASLDLSGDSLFDRFLSILHGLLSSCKPRWLKPKSASKSTVKSPRDFSVFDREAAESLQNDLDHMQLPETIRWRLQAAMPMPPPPSFSITCQPPTISSAAIASLQSPVFQHGNSNLPQKNLLPSSRAPASILGKLKQSQTQDQVMEVDPWTLLEDGSGLGSSLNNNSGVGATGDHANLKACNWLKGAVRVRRTDLTYIGAVDDR